MRGGRYEMIRPIASGGMATVYLGRAVEPDGTDKPVAIKMMHEQLAQQQHFVDMFLDEVKLAMRIHHPNVVATLDVVDSEETPFLVMDLVDGVTLQDMFQTRHGHVSAKVALRVVIDLLSGLHAAHELADAESKPLGIVHRDVSPPNILLGQDGVTKITDFGIAWAATRIATTRTGEVKGKVVYMAPEQVHGERVDRRADVYAAGLVMWELLTGKRHFDNEHEAVRLFADSRGAKSRLRDEHPSIPEALDGACMRALEYLPSDRYPTALAFAESLESAAKASETGVATHAEVAQAVAEILRRVEDERKAAAERRAVRRASIRPGADASGAYSKSADASGAYSKSADTSGAYSKSADTSGAYSPATGSEPGARKRPPPEGDSTPRKSGERATATMPATISSNAPAMLAAKPAPPGRMWAPWAVLLVLLAGVAGWAALRPAGPTSSQGAPSGVAAVGVPPAPSPTIPQAVAAAAASSPPSASAPVVAPSASASPEAPSASASAAPSAPAGAASSARPALTGRLPPRPFEPDMP